MLKFKSMKQDDYIKANRPAGLIKKLGLNPTVLWQWRKGVRSVSPADCVRIEKATGGVVSRQDLRSDWREIWPELTEEH